jgi:uncharacterized protein (DUF1501 family)
MRRRDFLKGLGLASVAGAVPSQLFATEESSSNDFKALVVVEMSGGNDGFNTFLPADNTPDITTGWGAFTQMRSEAVRPDDRDLTPELKKYIQDDGSLEFGAVENPYSLDGEVTNGYKNGFYFMDENTPFGGKVGINALMPEVAHLALQGRVAIIHNIGNLPKPLTKNDNIKAYPRFSAHNIGTTLMETGQGGSSSLKTGWLGRLSDELGAVNGDSIYPLNINMSPYGVNRMMYSFDAPTLNISSYGAVNFTFGSTRYETKVNRSALNAFKASINSFERRDMFRHLIYSSRKNSLEQIDTIISDLKEVDSAFDGNTNVYGDEGFFTFPTAELHRDAHGMEYIFGNNFNQPFKMAAKLIKIAQNRGLSRVVIYLRVGGWDHHHNLVSGHSMNLRGVSTGIGAFMKAIKSLGLEDNVTLINTSEFGRTLVDNGVGADHAWGGSYFVIGGAVNGGNYGTLPEMSFDSDYFLKRGTLIPTTAFTQQFATISKWLGASDEQILRIFPELSNFDKIDLGFMKA